jgi:hypothetical protein
MKKTIDTNITIGAGLYETVSRHGAAGAEFLKGLRGIDYETGQTFDRSLLDISRHKLHPDYIERNIKQQAGYSAEIASVSKRNAQAIKEGGTARFSRSEDIARYGKNHPVVDIVELLEGEEITSQMKFVTNQEGLLKKIACGEGGGKTDLSRYMQVNKLEAPTEQVENMKKLCRKQAKKLHRQAERMTRDGKNDLAQKFQKQADNYERLEQKISDSNMTTDEAIAYRLRPRWETSKDIAAVSHDAGIAGAKLGAAIGGSISLVGNLVAMYSGDKTFGEAVLDTGKDTLAAAGVGYASAFSGSAVKTLMQQSSGTIMRELSRTGLPAMIVSACLSTSKSITRFASGEIDAEAMLHEIGVSTSGMLSASMFTVIGQVAIPVPVLGSMIGGMIGYALTNTFYQSFFNVLKEKKLSAERLAIVTMQCEAARMLARAYQQELSRLFDEKLTQLDHESRALFATLDDPDISADDYCAGMNRFAAALGKRLTINNMAELDAAMLSDKPLII